MSINFKSKLLLAIFLIVALSLSLIFFIINSVNQKKSNINSSYPIIMHSKFLAENEEEKIKTVFLEKYSDWKETSFDLTIEKELQNYAIGNILWRKSKGKCFWFASKINNQWNIVDYGCGSYFGACKNFKEYNFPSELTPDCWDEDAKALINTPNPDQFYNGLNLEDKDMIKQAFLDFEKDSNKFFNKDIYILFNKVVGEYLKATILIGGTDNYSTSQILAVKDNDKWKVLYYGQENPPCKNIELYSFPLEIVSDCWDGEKWVK